MMWQLLLLWLYAHPMTTTYAFRIADINSQSSSRLRVQDAGTVLFSIDPRGQLHLRERDPAAIACSWARSLHVECKY
jgi:hypothetical protein